MELILSESNEHAEQGAETTVEETAHTPATEDTATAPGTEQTQTEQIEEQKSEESNKPPRWAKARIDELTREKHEARRQAEAIQRERDAYAAALAQYQSGQQVNQNQQVPGNQHQQQQAPLTQADLDRLANERAEQMLAQRRFVEEGERVYNAGKAKYADFDDALGAYQLLGGAPTDYIDAVQSLPNGEEVYYALGKNPDEAARVMKLPPVKMALELAKISAKISAPKPVSKVPAPISPVDGTSRGEPDPDKMSMAEWVKWREKNARR